MEMGYGRETGLGGRLVGEGDELGMDMGLGKEMGCGRGWVA